MGKRVVYYTQPYEEDFNELDDYGKAVYICSRNEHRPDFLDDDWKEFVSKRLERLEYNPESDFIVGRGHAPTMMAFIALIMERYEHIELIFHDRNRDDYQPVTFGDSHEHTRDTKTVKGN